MAAIDAHSWPLLNTHGITIIDRSACALAPSFVMHAGAPLKPQQLAAALAVAIDCAGEAIGIRGRLDVSRRDYRLNSPGAPVSAGSCALSG
ncbi:hypothetical protein Q9290_06560 [Oceanimonas sp. CHS3-5]|uniref:hypothetical protein n=1 Tax=Oceanimonas sp. CHS3-5 TaxID=3068186 RepID=UPI00273E9BFA|nr:hypothetical protein [Oceanimonas sp. CHS3-5]MDP5291951.1 hypothetical protein [Oceanimonas sp. CHS3-5]